MPRNIQTYTTCAPPGAAKSHKNYGGFTGWLITNFLDATTSGKAAFVAFFLVLVGLLFANPITALITYGIIVSALYEVNDWYYNLRLLCVRPGNSCLVGTVLNPSNNILKNSFDGDATFNILPAPYTRLECFEVMNEHLAANKGLLTNPATFNDPPFNFVAGIETHFPSILDLGEVKKYLNELDGEPIPGNDKDLRSNVYNHLYIGFLDRLFARKSGQNFNSHFLRKDSNVITDTATWNAIPNDHDPNKDWLAPNASFYNDRFSNVYELPNTKLGLNPMFKISASASMPFVHCEIDGNNVSILINLIVAALAAVLVLIYTFFNPIAALILLLLLGLITLSGLGIIGDAAVPDFDFEDSEPSGEALQLNGDVIAVQGQWVMDTEHGQFFEIHPVRAYHVVGRSEGRIDIFDTSDERDKSGFTKLTNADITAELADEICKLTHDTETSDPPPVLTRTVPQALSYGLTTRYGGGGIR